MPPATSTRSAVEIVLGRTGPRKFFFLRRRVWWGTVGQLLRPSWPAWARRARRLARPMPSRRVRAHRRNTVRPIMRRPTDQYSPLVRNFDRIKRTMVRRVRTAKSSLVARYHPFGRSSGFSTTATRTACEPS